MVRDLARAHGSVGGQDGVDVVTVVLNWEGWPRTLACLESLDRQTFSRQAVVVVDNGSSDDSVARLREARPRLEFIQTGANLGYAGGMNAGMRRALEVNARYIWLLNNDTEPEPEALSALVDCAESQPAAGALASVGRTRSVGGDGPRTYATAYRYGGRHLYPVYCEEKASTSHPCHAADIVTGGSILLRGDALRQVGLLDEHYFHYAEEHDLVERMRRADWRAALACRSVVPHARGAALDNRSPQASYYYLRNHLRLRRKLWGESAWRAVIGDPKLVRRTLPLRVILSGDLRPLVVTGLALLDAIRGRAGRRDLGPRYRSAPTVLQGRAARRES